MSKGFASTYRIVLLSGALLLCFGGVGVRLVWLHVINRDELLGSIAKTRRQLIVEKSRRGDIYDATGALLATSRSVLQLGVDPHSLRKEDEKHWPELVRLLRPYFAKEHLTEEKLRLILTTKYRAATPATGSVPATVAGLPSAGQTGFVFNLKLPPPAPVATVATGPAAVGTDLDAEATEVRPGADTIAVDAVDETELAPEAEVGGRRKIQWAKLVDDLPEATYDEIKKLGIKGVYATSSYRRSYPHNQLGAHVVGFVHQGQPVIEGVKRIDHPIAGVERFADFYLRGQDGWREGEKDGRAKELPQFRTRTVELVDGYDVTLSLDTRVQNIVERELAIIAEKFDPLKATIIVSDPRTGFILGMGNYPSFNPNEYNKLRDDQLGRLKNIATSDVYDPGSVFKIVAASAALDQGIVTPDTRFDCSIIAR
jgi:cell division protein FtsI (penicillin-binding protein 3)